MNPASIPAYLIGRRSAILEIAGNRWSLLIGFLLVVSGGLARNYDGAYLTKEWTVLLHGPTGKVIADACDGVIDLLVVGSRGYGPIQRALLGSVSEELIARARHPVLVIPRQPSAGHR